MDWAGLSDCSSEPELYQNTSVISPVDSRVLTTLSPSVPCGRVSVLILIVGLAFWKASTSPLACVRVDSLLSIRKDSVTVPPPESPPDSPPEPQAVTAARASAATAAPSAR
jgi:hypothetical protein